MTPSAVAGRATRQRSIGAKVAGGLAATAILLALAHGAAGCAVADVQVQAGSPSQAGSSAVAVHGNDDGGTRVQVIRYPDGHGVITRDGSSTDITVQRLPPAGWSANGQSPAAPAERFMSPESRERFGSWPYTGAPTEAGAGSAREEFRQRMLQRIGGHP